MISVHQQIRISARSFRVRKKRRSFAWNMGERWREEVVGNIRKHDVSFISITRKSRIGKYMYRVYILERFALLLGMTHPIDMNRPNKGQVS